MRLLSTTDEWGTLSQPDPAYSSATCKDTFMIHVVAVITTKPGMRSVVLALFNANRPAVLAEEGCIEYVPTIDAQGTPPGKGSLGPDTFVVIEKWDSLAALQAHATAPHMAAYVTRTREMVESRMIHVLEGA